MLTHALLALSLLIAPAAAAPPDDEQPERWFFDLETPGGALPIELCGSPNPFAEHENAGGPYAPVIVNGDERIPLIRGVVASDGGVFSCSYRVSGYSSGFSVSGQLSGGVRGVRGSWAVQRRGGKVSIPFAAEQRDQRFPLPDTPPAIDSGRYRVVFASSPDDPAVGLFTINTDGTAAGTFLTTTGDYRYLAGNAAGDTLKLSTFDGAHAFLFHAERHEDGSLTGDFWSGTWWHDTWTATPDPDFRLPDPFDQTTFRGDTRSLERLTFENLEGIPTPVGALAPHGSPRIVEVFGSWCPNCHDATRLLTVLHAQYKDRGLKVVGLAFEHSDDPEKAAASVRRYAADLGVEYPLLIAGLSDKQKAGESLPVLDRVRSFPTTLFIDADGDVRAVHSGFSGPATGEAHAELRAAWVAHIEAMLEEAAVSGMPQD